MKPESMPIGGETLETYGREIKGRLGKNWKDEKREGQANRVDRKEENLCKINDYKERHHGLKRASLSWGRCRIDGVG